MKITKIINERNSLLNDKLSKCSLKYSLEKEITRIDKSLENIETFLSHYNNELCKYRDMFTGLESIVFELAILNNMSITEIAENTNYSTTHISRTKENILIKLRQI